MGLCFIWEIGDKYALGLGFDRDGLRQAHTHTTGCLRMTIGMIFVLLSYTDAILAEHFKRYGSMFINIFDNLSAIRKMLK